MTFFWEWERVITVYLEKFAWLGGWPADVVGKLLWFSTVQLPSIYIYIYIHLRAWSGQTCTRANLTRPRSTFNCDFGEISSGKFGSLKGNAILPYWHKVLDMIPDWYRYVDFHCALYHIIWKSWFNFQRKNKQHHSLVCLTFSFPSLKNCAWSLTCHPLPQVAICLCCWTSVTETIWSVLFFTDTVGVSMLNPFRPVIIFIHNVNNVNISASLCC